MTPRGALPCLALVLLLVSVDASADWTMFRRDPERTGYAPDSTFINRPAPIWRYFLGGTLGTEQYWAGDLDGDGTREVVYLSGGRVVAKLPNDEHRFVHNGTADLDGDGVYEVVTSFWASP